MRNEESIVTELLERLDWVLVFELDGVKFALCEIIQLEASMVQ